MIGSNNGEVTQGNSPGDTKAYDARTGAKLWTFVSKLNATGAATPMTYQGRNGKQYVVQASAGTLNAFTLP